MAELGEVRGITVRGTGRVPVTPDQATITLGVEGRAKAAGGAQAAASTAMSAVIAALDELAIAPRDRTTTG
ncbi:MAG: SIMPL domain-containing protein, partial [Candidatus Limnocylindrales bacterium]